MRATVILMRSIHQILRKILLRRWPKQCGAMIVQHGCGIFFQDYLLNLRRLKKSMDARFGASIFGMDRHCIWSLIRTESSLAPLRVKNARFN